MLEWYTLAVAPSAWYQYMAEITCELSAEKVVEAQEVVVVFCQIRLHAPLAY